MTKEQTTKKFESLLLQQLWSITKFVGLSNSVWDTYHFIWQNQQFHSLFRLLIPSLIIVFKSIFKHSESLMRKLEVNIDVFEPGSQQFPKSHEILF